MKTLIRNIGQIVSGDITHPVVDADSLLARDGVIIGLGQGLEDDADLVVDAKGSTVMPAGPRLAAASSARRRSAFEESPDDASRSTNRIDRRSTSRRSASDAR